MWTDESKDCSATSYWALWPNIENASCWNSKFSMLVANGFEITAFPLREEIFYHTGPAEVVDVKWILPVAQFPQQEIVKCFCCTNSEAPEREHLTAFLSVSNMGQLSNLSIITTITHILRWNKTRTTKKKYKRFELRLRLMSKIFQSSGNLLSSGSFRIYFKASVKNERIENGI